MSPLQAPMMLGGSVARRLAPDSCVDNFSVITGARSTRRSSLLAASTSKMRVRGCQGFGVCPVECSHQLVDFLPRVVRTS